MSDRQTERPPESADQRAARWLNVTMAMLIAICAAAAAIWMLVISIPPVVAIYRSLSNDQQRQLTAFASMSWAVLFGAALALRSLGDWLARRRDR